MNTTELIQDLVRICVEQGVPFEYDPYTEELSITTYSKSNVPSAWYINKTIVDVPTKGADASDHLQAAIDKLEKMV